MALEPARVKAVFQGAMDQTNAAQRAAFLDQECAGDLALRARVEQLLGALDAPSSALERPLAAAAHAATDAGSAVPQDSGIEATVTAAEAPTRTFESRPLAESGTLIAGRYILQERIGEGGMGEVWVAKQTEPVKRKVALKLIKPGMDSRAVLQRFEQERQALALMDHPHIAKVLDAGLTPQGQPFFVMELVNGLALTKFCDEARLTPRQRLELFVPICQAVQHAHQKGIVHRDLKPANILVTLVDGKPVPKVIDFGVAKATAGRLTEDSLSTQFGAVVGTLEYMAPEQAGFTSEDIDTRADIYSLGVILYELLTGLRPIDARRLKQAALSEMVRIIREEEPSKPSTRLSTDASLPSLAAVRQTEPRKLMAMLRGELDWVVMKCLEKPRERRYETANALVRDVQRYLADEAVEARPPSTGYRFSKFVKRHKGQVIAAGLVLLALLGGIVGTSYGLFRANRATASERLAKEDALKQKRRAEAREQQAIDAVKRFGDAVVENETLKNSPELEALRKILLKEPLAFFKSLRETLQADGDTRPEALARLGSAAFDLGNLTYEIGDKQNARRVYEAARAIFQSLADAHPTVTQYQSDLAGSHFNLGSLLTQTGQPAEARRAYEAALAIRQVLADAHPDVARYQSDLAASHENLGILLHDTGQPAEARRELETGLAISKKLANANPTVAAYHGHLASSNHNLGALLRETGQLTEARRAYEAALAIQQKLADANPTVAEYQSDLASSHQSLGSLLHDISQLAEARRAYEAALGIRQKLVDAHPTVTEYQSDLAGSHQNLGVLLMETGQPADARRAYEAALAIRQALANAHPESPAYASNMGGMMNNLASLDMGEQRWIPARAKLKQAISWQKKALARYPKHPEYRQFLRNHLTNLIRVATALGNDAEAAEAEREMKSLNDGTWDPKTNYNQ